MLLRILLCPIGWLIYLLIGGCRFDNSFHPRWEWLGLWMRFGLKGCDAYHVGAFIAIVSTLLPTAIVIAIIKGLENT